MSETCKNILIFLVGSINYLACVAQLITYSDEFNLPSFRCSVYAATYVWHRLENEVNIAGRIVATLIVGLFLLPSTVLILIVSGLMKLCIAIWDAYKYIFRKKERKHD